MYIYYIIHKKWEYAMGYHQQYEIWVCLKMGCSPKIVLLMGKMRCPIFRATQVSLKERP